MKHRVPRRLQWSPAVLPTCVVLIVVACGGGDDDPGTDGAGGGAVGGVSGKGGSGGAQSSGAAGEAAGGEGAAGKSVGGTGPASGGHSTSGGTSTGVGGGASGSDPGSGGMTGGMSSNSGGTSGGQGQRGGSGATPGSEGGAPGPGSEGGRGDSGSHAGGAANGGAGGAGDESAGAGAGGGSVSPPECSPGAKHCEGKGLATCDASGQWGQPASCPFVCSDDACAGECVPDAQQCASGQIQKCSALGHWAGILQCTVACADTTRCAFPNECGHWLQGCCAAPGERCQSDAVCQTRCTLGTTCDAFGGCSCINNASQSSCVRSDCTQNPKSCPSGTDCVDLGDTAECMKICSAPGAGQSNCLEGTVCLEMGGSFGTQGACFPRCDLPGLACTTGVCNAQGYCVECVVGSSRCNGATVETCGADQTWEPQETCDSVCDQGTCKECAPGWGCDGTSMNWCSAEGTSTQASIACTASCDPELGRCNNSLSGDCARLLPCCSVLGSLGTGCRNVANAGNDSICYNWLRERWTQGDCRSGATTGLQPSL